MIAESEDPTQVWTARFRREMETLMRLSHPHIIKVYDAGESKGRPYYVMELVNATRKAIDSGCGREDPAVREATEAVAILLSLVAPYTAEEMWERLGHQPTVARAGWPAVDETLLVEDSVLA